MTAVAGPVQGSIGMHQHVYALAASPNFAVDSICFAAGDQGVYRSDDGGVTWNAALASLNLAEPLPATTVVLSPEFPTDQQLFAGVPGGCLRSSDGSASWVATVFPAPPPTISQIVISPNVAVDKTVIAGTTADGMWRTTDGGADWYPWNFGLFDLHVVSLAVSPDFAHDQTVFVGTETGLFRSTNGGRSWRELALPAWCAPVISLAIAPNIASDQMLFVGTEAHGLWRSHDGGMTWEQLAADQIQGAVSNIVLIPEDPVKPHLLVVASNLLISRDGGTTWVLSGSPDIGAAEILAVAAPMGLHRGVPLLVALESGGVQCIQITH